MVTREEIVVEVKKIPEKYLEELYQLIKDLESRSIPELSDHDVMAKLREIKISASPDFQPGLICMTPTATPMPDRIFLDTSFVIALINEKDQYHAQAEALSFRFANSPLLTTGAVFLEIGNALSRDFRAEAVSIIRVLSSSSRVEVVETDSSLRDKGLAVYEKYADKKWGFVDCVSFVVMREAGITQALTFDKDFEQAGFTVLSG